MSRDIVPGGSARVAHHLGSAQIAAASDKVEEEKLQQACTLVDFDCGRRTMMILRNIT